MSAAQDRLIEAQQTYLDMVTADKPYRAVKQWDRANARRELAQLRADVARLTQERDEAQAAMNEARDLINQALNGMINGWRDYANGHYCRTYNAGMSQGLNCAADALEAYVSGLSESAHPAPETLLKK